MYLFIDICDNLRHKSSNHFLPYFFFARYSSLPHATLNLGVDVAHHGVMERDLAIKLSDSCDSLNDNLVTAYLAVKLVMLDSQTRILPRHSSHLPLFLLASKVNLGQCILDPVVVVVVVVILVQIDLS